MQKIFLYQVYTNLAYVPPMYRRFLKIRVLIIKKNVPKSLASINKNYIFIWSWNNPTVTRVCGSYIGVINVQIEAVDGKNFVGSIIVVV